MRDFRKAQLEIASFENLLRLGNISFDRYESQKPPEPDIVAWRGTHCFGIEVTNFHRQAERRRESEEDGIIARALELYNQCNGPSIELSIMWAPHFKIEKKDREKLVRGIVTLALNYAPHSRGWITLDWHNFDSYLMCVIDHMSMYGMPDGQPSHWTAGRDGFVPNWDVTDLQTEIDRKKEKPRGYCTRYIQIWLLVVSSFGEPSSWMEMTDEVRLASFISPFDKIFLLSSFPHEVVELRAAQL